ncbi:hypothetical protein [Oceanobacillus sp. CF4.6]|uniref:hypothetical protein n=1 Tax=Oceanobacillus sp. CF4.6 TaxID=3373080 RepID=UPI003EE43695
MKKLGRFGISTILFIFISFVFSACSEDESIQESSDKSVRAEMEEDTEEDLQENLPEDEVLFTVIENNVNALTNGNQNEYKNTVHSESPVYDQTVDTMKQLSPYQLDMELSGLSVEEKTEEEARVSFTQTTIKMEGSEFQNNKTSGIHVLKNENGNWKIYQTEVEEVITLDEDVLSEEVTMEGEYTDYITNLKTPFDDGGWTLGNYQEAEGEAIAEYLPSNEDFSNLTELLTIHYYQDGNHHIGIENFLSEMENNLTEVSTGSLEFNRLEQSSEEGIIEFALTDDEVLFDQEEVVRVFIKENDLFALRYTTLEKKIDNKKAWIDMLKDIQ